MKLTKDQQKRMEELSQYPLSGVYGHDVLMVKRFEDGYRACLEKECLPVVGTIEIAVEYLKVSLPKDIEECEPEYQMLKSLEDALIKFKGEKRK